MSTIFSTLQLMNENPSMPVTNPFGSSHLGPEVAADCCFYLFNLRLVWHLLRGRLNCLTEFEGQDFFEFVLKNE